MRLAAFVLTSLLLVVLSPGSAQDKNKPDNQKTEAADKQPSPPPPNTAIEINIGTTPNAAPSQTQKNDSTGTTKPAPPTQGEELIAVITAVYALFSILTYFMIRRQAKSAEAELAAQSPWIMVNIEHTPGMHGRFTGASRTGNEPETHHTDFIFRFDCINHGRTPALITEKRANLIIVPKNALPKNPDLRATRVFDDRVEPLAANQKSVREKDEYFSAPGYQSLDDWVVLYGVVKFREVFGRDRQTTFGYEVTIGDKIERLSGYPKYNENT